MNQQLDPNIIETLKAARNQVVQVDPAPEQVPMESRILDKVGTRYGAGKSGMQFTVRDKSAPIVDKFLTGFAEEFVQKLSAIEQETAAVDEEIVKLEKIWLNLAEKKKQLENRRNELIKVKDKLKELDDEMSAVLKSQ